MEPWAALQIGDRALRRGAVSFFASPGDKSGRVIIPPRDSEMHRSGVAAALALLPGAFVVCMVTVPILDAQQQPALYQRLGGSKVIAALTEDVFSHAALDPRASRLFKGQTKSSQEHRQQAVENLVCAITGGPCPFPKESFGKTCDALRITDDEWEHLRDHLKEALVRQNVPEKERAELLTQMEELRPAVIQM